MVKRVRKFRNTSRQAFTLTELIVVLVVLALLAAVLVPALTGYIKKARRENQVETTYNARVAAQAVMTELYGLGDGNASSTQTTDGNNVLWYKGTDKSWGDKVLQLMDRGRGAANNEPYILIVGVGTHDPDAGLSLDEQYTVYYVALVEEEDSDAVFYINGDFFYGYPRRDNGTVMTTRTIGGKNFRNTIIYDGVEIPVQFFIISNRTGIDPNSGSFWTGTNPQSLYSHSDGYAT